MKIKRIQIIGLNKSTTPIDISFNDDINILTGRNGSGKTTILKLMWYCVSANIERAVREIIFENVIVETSCYSLNIKKEEHKKNRTVNVLLTSSDGEILLNKKEAVYKDVAVELANRLTIDLLNTSVFFPTFRRIEGGFSMTESKQGRINRLSRINMDDAGFMFEEGMYGFGPQIEEALSKHSNRLSVGNHKFVSSISTVDIKKIVTKKHNEATTIVDNYSKNLSESIFLEIKNYKSSKSSGEEVEALRDAVSTLDKINQDVVEFEKIREDAFKPLTILSDIILSIFEHKGIRLNLNVTLGDLDESINSDALSAGEKQMLSFLCYNALYSNCPFFIDEPELSLHVDWQRILLDVMIKQKTNNQFFVATHSPFIYTQYEDKEIMISSDRGCNVE